MGAAVSWVITREREDGQPLVDELRSRGLDAVSVPAIERAPVAIWPRELEIDLGTDDDARSALWFLTSPYCARLTLEHLGAQQVRRALFAVVAPATKRVLDDAGAGDRAIVVAAGGALALARAVVDNGWRGAVLYPTSDAGLASPEQREAVDVLTAAGGRVHRAAIYATRPRPGLTDDLRALGRPWFGIAWSPSAVAALAAAVDDGAPPPFFLACVGASTKRAEDEAHVAPASALVPPGVDVADFVFAYPHAPQPRSS